MRRYCFAFLMAFALFSCKEDTRINKIQGRLFQECDQAISGGEVALKTNETGSFSNSLILGSAITDGNGNFSFTYELEEGDIGTGDLIYVNRVGFETLRSGVTLNQDLNIELHRNNNIELYVELGGSRVFSSNDTLFYGVESMESFTIQPSSGFIDTLAINILNREGGSTSSEFYYGVGSSDFLKSKEAASIQDSVFQNISLSIMTCIPDTASFVIN